MSDEKQEVWAIVELLGHVKLAGRLSEEEKFGAKMGRLDIPKKPDPKCDVCRGKGAIEIPEDADPAVPCPRCSGFVTQFFGGGSVYRITIVSEDVARHVAKGNVPTPVSPWDFPKQLAAAERSRPYMPDDADDDDFATHEDV